MKPIYFAAKAVVIHEGQFLAMHQPKFKTSSYELPGGKMEFGETAEQTVVREVFEETNLRVVPICLLDTWNFVGDDFQITGVIFLCMTDNIDNFTLSDEHDSYEWLPANAESAEKMQVLFRPQMQRWDWDMILAQR